MQLDSFISTHKNLWDGSSWGTKYTIDYAKEQGKPIKIINYITNNTL